MDQPARKFADRVAALAGRRIDGPCADVVRFAPAAAARVKKELEALFDREEIGTVVSSAACGADILAAEAAQARGMRTRIVLPFDQARFRKTSVTDRGLEWGERFDAVIKTAASSGDVLVLTAEASDDDAAYAAVTRKIVQEAAELARQSGAPGLAIAVWNGMPREGGDATQDFIDRASEVGLTQLFISTLKY
jgi:hypothetical protein